MAWTPTSSFPAVLGKSVASPFSRGSPVCRPDPKVDSGDDACRQEVWSDSAGQFQEALPKAGSYVAKLLNMLFVPQVFWPDKPIEIIIRHPGRGLPSPVDLRLFEVEPHVASLQSSPAMLNMVALDTVALKETPGSPSKPREAPGGSRKLQEDQEAPGSPKKPQEAPGSPRKLQEAPGGPRKPQEAPGGPKSPQQAPGSPRKV